MGYTEKNSAQASHLKRYYRFHSHVYDATRWSFLFGRNKIMSWLPELPPQPRILEVGCGTGKNMKQLSQKFPDAQLQGVDLSAEMLNVARQKLNNLEHIELTNVSYGSDSFQTSPCDLILLSYSLTMTGDNTKSILKQLAVDLKPKGYLAVVDFNKSPFKWFKRWMAINHADLSGSALSLLTNHFYPERVEKNDVYMGLWSYFLFLGRRYN